MSGTINLITDNYVSLSQERSKTAGPQFSPSLFTRLEWPFYTISHGAIKSTISGHGHENASVSPNQL